MHIAWLPYVYTFLASVGGGVVQSTTGFGYGIFVMIFFPLFLPLIQASALSSAISFFLVTTLTWKYRRYIKLRDVIVPSLFYLLVSTVLIWYAPGFDFHIISIVYAVFMIVLAVYMLFFSARLKIKANVVSALLCSGVSGAGSGLFGIGGPPMTLYYMALYGGDKYHYLGTLQCFFWITGLANNITRLSNGLLSKDVLLLIIPGFLGQAIGVWIGGRIVGKISQNAFKYVVYGFLAVSGVITLITKL